MSHEIRSRLEEYIRQEQALLDRLLQLKRQQVDVRKEISIDVLGEAVTTLIEDLFESSRASRLGRKIVRTILSQRRKEEFLIQEESIERQHNSLVQSIREFLSSVSLWRKNLKEPNSSKLVAKLDKAQEFVKDETRIRKTIIMLKSIMSKPLIYNRDILSQQVAKEVVVPPGKPFTGMLKLKEILKSVRGYVKIIDPYVDETALELLLSVPEGLSIKLLTAYTGGKGKERRFKRACKRFKVERPLFEVRKCDPELIHDRFILTRTQGWSIGSSLKDFGKKLTMIKELSDHAKREAENIFDQMWEKSIDLLT